MASTEVVIWCLLLFTATSAQILNTSRTDNGICKDVVCTTTPSKCHLEGCVVVLGYLKLYTMEKTNSSDFVNITFPDLREVTGYVVVYRIVGLESLGQLFPNLARIRGKQLHDSFGLIVHDVQNLRDIGLYSLLKIDRGGVEIWGGPHTCYVNTVDWETIAPHSRHVLAPPDKDAHCNFECTCTDNAATNHCWSNRKCQRYLEGPDAERCNEQCLGCRKTNPDVCTLCRHYTYRGHCVAACPDDTIILPENQYCITPKECKKLKGWTWNNTCVFECPVDYNKTSVRGKVTCKRCWHCQITCGDKKIQSLSQLQQAEPCVYINGSLTIHVRAVPYVMEELRIYLGRIKEIKDFLVIHGSLTITSLDFLSSLQAIRGRKLVNNEYSVIIRDMLNLQTLFAANVTKNLKIYRGKLKILGNPVLCMTEIEKIKSLFPVKSNERDIPIGMNGYSGGCTEVTVGLEVKVWNETSATILFWPSTDSKTEYTVLYVRLPQGAKETIVPETCSESEWHAVSASNTGIVNLNNLRPASRYAVCIETYSYSDKPLESPILARSSIINFTTPVGKPAPPFITELVASSSNVVVLRWVDHKDYRPHIVRYELDVSLIEIHPGTIAAKDHCNIDDVSEDLDYTRHAVVLRPPPGYDRGCESMCGVLSTVTAGAMAEDHFEVCSLLDADCDKYDATHARTNSSFGKYIRTITLDIPGPRNDYQVGKLAPFRDYKFQLRACVQDKCSRITRATVRTLRSSNADIPKITSCKANETGHVSVKWKSPNITNGPILAYSIHVLPYIAGEMGYILPQSWCVSADKRQIVVKSQIVARYKVRICATTLGSINACGEWERVLVPGFDYKSLFRTPDFTNILLWGSILFSFSIIAISAMLGYLLSKRAQCADNTLIPLVEDMEENESDPPVMLRDFVPFYSVPLTENLRDY